MNRCFVALIGAVLCAAEQPWDHYNLSPTSRVLSVPGAVLPVTRTFGAAQIDAPSFLFDFKNDIGGDVSITLGATEAATGGLWVWHSQSLSTTRSRVMCPYTRGVCLRCCASSAEHCCAADKGVQARHPPAGQFSPWRGPLLCHGAARAHRHAGGPRIFPA